MAKNLFELLNKQTPKPKKKGFFSRYSEDTFVETSDEPNVSKLNEPNVSELNQSFGSYSDVDRYGGMNVESVDYTDDGKATVVLEDGTEIPNLKVVHLSELHEKGEYHPEVDVTVYNKGYMKARDESLKAVWEDPENAALMDVSRDINRHNNKIFAYLMEHGGMDCEFYDNEGNKLDYSNQECDEYGRPDVVDRLSSHKLDALMYGLDHGLVQCKMQDGTMYDPKAIDDGFIDNLDYYDSKLEALDKAQYEVEKRTANIIESDFAAGRTSSYIPDYLKSDEMRQRFVSDLQDEYMTSVSYYAKAMACYKAGKNPYEQMLESMNMSPSAEKVETKALGPIHDMQTLHQAEVQPELSKGTPTYSKATNDKIQAVLASASNLEASGSEPTLDNTYGN